MFREIAFWIIIGIVLAVLRLVLRLLNNKRDQFHSFFINIPSGLSLIYCINNEIYTIFLPL